MRDVFALCAGVYLLLVGGQFYTSDGDVMFHTTAALAKHGSFEVAPDPSLPQIVAGTGGAHYGKYDPGLPLLAVPFYVTGDWIAAVNHAHRYGLAALFVLFVPALAAAGAAAGVAFLAHSVAPRSANLGWVVIAAGLASPLLVYARTLFAEAVLACVLTWSVALAARGGAVRSFGAGAMLGAGIAVRAAAAIYALPVLALVVAGRGRHTGATSRVSAGRLGRGAVWRAVWFGIGLLPGIALVLWHNTLRFGDPLTFGYGGESFGTPLWQGIAGLLFSPGRSVFLYAPPLILSVMQWPRFRRAERALADTLALAWAVALVVYGAWWAWHGGWAWGPRLVVPLIPLSMLPLIMLPEGRAWRGAAILLIALGGVINGAGALVDVTPHFAASGTLGDTGASAAWFALRELAAGRTETLALFRVGDLGLPLTWRIGLPGLALVLIAWGVWRATGRWRRASSIVKNSPTI